MATTNTPTTLASRLKEVYPEGITQLVPAANELFGKRLKFRKDLITGEKARFDVSLSGEQGFTTGQGDVTLNGSVAQQTAKAEVEGWSLILQSNASYDTISRAKTSKTAFATFASGKLIPVAESYRTRGEIMCMGYGRQGIATVSSVDTGVITVTNASWCPAMLLTMIGATVEAYAGGTQHNGDLVISAVSVANKTMTVTGTSSSVAAADVIYLKGHKANCAYGIMDIARNTGTLYNISAATYDLWSANHFDVGTSPLTLGKISEASAMSADKGCVEKLTCLVPTAAFQLLSNNESALREYEANYNKAKAETGFESIVLNGACGPIEIIPYMFVKQGEFVMFPERLTNLIGSEEMTNQVGGSGDIFFDLQDSSAKQIRVFGDWTVFCEKPGYITYGTRSDSKALHE